MRIECPQCEAWGPADIHKLEGQEVHFRCASCAVSFAIQVSSADASPSEHPAVPGAREGSCPKCDSPVAAKEDCPSCGLRRIHFEGFDDGTSEADTSQLDTAWAAVLSAWDDPEAHSRFVNLAARDGDYRGAARRYREACSEQAKVERAKEMLQRIQTMASAALLSSKPKLELEEEPFKAVVVLLMVLVLLAGVGGIYVMMKSRRSTPAMDVPATQPAGYKRKKRSPRPAPMLRVAPEDAS